ncbi:MAG: hypothetical protein WED11_06290, partial [Natronospirillum sp.]
MINILYRLRTRRLLLSATSASVLMSAFLAGSLGAVLIPVAPLEALPWVTGVAVALIAVSVSCRTHYLYRYLSVIPYQSLVLGMMLGYGWTITAVGDASAARLSTTAMVGQSEVRIDRCWRSAWGTRCLVKNTHSATRWYLHWAPDLPMPVVGDRGLIDATLSPW